MAGVSAVTVKSGGIDGLLVDLDDLTSKLDDHTAVFMITNPNTLGLSRTEHQAEISRAAA